MIIEEGYVYHIKNEYFEFVKDEKLMTNHEGDSTRPNYFCIKINDENVMWFVPMSSKVEKYKKIIQNKMKKYKKCDTIVIGNYRGREHAFLIQNMFPITEKYIDHIDTIEGKALKVPSETRRNIERKVEKVLLLKEKGINLIFPNVDKITEKLLKELKNGD